MYTECKVDLHVYRLVVAEMLLAMYLMLLLVAFTVAAPPQYVNPDYEPSYDDDVEVEEGEKHVLSIHLRSEEFTEGIVLDVVAVPPEEEFDIVVHRVARQGKA